MSALTFSARNNVRHIRGASDSALPLSKTMSVSLSALPHPAPDPAHLIPHSSGLLPSGRPFDRVAVYPPEGTRIYVRYKSWANFTPHGHAALPAAAALICLGEDTGFANIGN